MLLVPWENLTIKRKRVRKSGKIAKKNEKKIRMIFVVAMISKGLCSGFIAKYRLYPENYEK